MPKSLLSASHEAAEQAKMDIIVNFEHLKLATPDALKALVDSDAIKAAVPNVKVRYRKFKDAFESSLQGLSLVGPRNVVRGFARCITSNTGMASSIASTCRSADRERSRHAVLHLQPCDADPAFPASMTAPLRTSPTSSHLR